MCTHEHWTYQECGCTVDHHIECLDLENQSYRSSAQPPPRDSPPAKFGASSRSSPHSPINASTPESYEALPSPSPTPPSTSDSDSEDNSKPEDYYHAHLRVDHPIRIRPTKPRVNQIKTQPQHIQSNEAKPRSCSTSRTTHKTFLEPICDDCLLDEIGVKRYSGVFPSVDGANDAQHAVPTQEEEEEQRGRSGHARNGSGLIWSSDVQIEITPSSISSTAQAQVCQVTGSFPSSISQPQIIHSPAHNSTTCDNPHSNAFLHSNHIPAPAAISLSATANPTPKRFTNIPPGISRIDSAQKSSIDLARRRPWLLKELEAYMRKNSGTGVATTKAQSHGTRKSGDGSSDEQVSLDEKGILDEKEKETLNEKEILESTVEVKVLDESGMNDALESRMASSTARPARINENASVPGRSGDLKTATEEDSPISSLATRFRFPSTQFPHAPSLSLSPSPFTAGPISASAYSLDASIPARQFSTASVTVSTLDDTDADDEMSLYTSSPAPTSLSIPDTAAFLVPATTLTPDLDPTATPLSPNITTRRPRPHPRPDTNTHTNTMPNTKTKALRRRGLDISRSSFAMNALRLSSAWGSRERECLKGFRDDILGRGRSAEEVEVRGGDVERDAGKEVTKESVMGEREGLQEATLNVEEKNQGLEMQPILDAKEESTEADDSSIGKAGREVPWSEDVLKSLDEVSLPNKLPTQDSAEPPLIKFQRTDAHSSEVSGTVTRGRTRGRSPAKTLLTRFTKAQTDGKMWAKSVLGDLKRSLSRDSRGWKLRAANERQFDLEAGDAVIDSDGEASKIKAAVGATYTLRAVIDDSSKEDVGHRTDTCACDRRGSEQTTTSQDTTTSIHRASEAEANLYLHPTATKSEFNTRTASNESWQAHLSHDLALPRTTKKYVLRNAGFSQSEARLPSSTANYYAGKSVKDGKDETRRYFSAGTLGKNWFARSSPILPSGEDRCEYESGEWKKRLLSSSTGPSVPGTASGMSSGTWVATDPGSGAGSGNWKGERLASIVGSDDFEEDEGLIGSPWVESVGGAGHATGIEAPLNAAAVSTSSTFGNGERHFSTQVDITSVTAQHGRLRSASYPGHRPAPMDSTTPDLHQSVNTSPERPRNPTPLAAPSFRFKPRLPPNQAMLTQHAPSTPLRVSTPARAILPERTSSLSPPPISTPSRVGSPPNFAFTFTSDVEKPAWSAPGPPFSGTGRKEGTNDEMAEFGVKSGRGTLKSDHSPTSNSACVWKRYLCAGGCGGVVGEEIDSCVCERPRGADKAKQGVL